MSQSIEELLSQLVQMQRDKVLKCGREFVPNLTSEDVLQPVDFPELEYNPHFRYEEGVLEGIMTVETALRALLKSH